MSKKHNAKRISPAEESELNRLLHQNNGLLRVEDVVEAARSPLSPLHNRFEWDDTEAAEKWRQQQARFVLNGYYIYDPTIKTEVRVFTSLPSDHDTGGYRLTSEVVKSDLRHELVAMAMSELKRAEDRFRDVRELARVWEAVEEAQAEITEPVRKVGTSKKLSTVSATT